MNDPADNPLIRGLVLEIADSASLSVAQPLDVTLLSGGKSNLTYRISNGRSAWILRRPPEGHVVRGAHDVAREYRVQRALLDTRVPVARVIGLVDPSPSTGLAAYLMEEVEGTVLRSREQIAELSAHHRAGLAGALIETLVDLHEVDVAEVGLEGYGRPDGFIQRQLNRWSSQYEEVRFRVLPGFDEMLGLLRSTTPTTGEPGLVHGDYRIDNVIVEKDDPTRIAAVLDWEMATVGDTLTDLGTLLSFWDEPGRAWNPITRGLTDFPGFPSARDIAGNYLARRGLERADLAWYVLFAHFKLAVIMEQIVVRKRGGQTPDEGFETVDDMPQVLVDAGLQKWHSRDFHA